MRKLSGKGRKDGECRVRGGKINGGRKKKHVTDGEDRHGDRCGERSRTMNTRNK